MPDDGTKHVELGDSEQSVDFSYSVAFEESDVPWASRWDVYLTTKAVDIHWFSILNSIVVVLSLSGEYDSHRT